MGKTKGCEIARRYAEFIKSLLKISLDNKRELGAVFCVGDGYKEPKLGYTSIGEEDHVAIPPCPPTQESIGTIHTHTDTDFFSSVDYLALAAKDDEFSCIAYLDEHGNPYVKCIHRPENVRGWLDKIDELQKLEEEAARAYAAYEHVFNQVMNIIEEEGEIRDRAAILKELSERREELLEKFEKLREKAIELEPDACVVKL